MWEVGGELNVSGLPGVFPLLLLVATNARVPQGKSVQQHESESLFVFPANY